MNNEVITQILLALISIAGMLVVHVLVPYLKTKTTKEQREDIEYWVSVAIHAVEVYYKNNPNKGDIKKEYVMNFMRDLGYSVTDEQIGMLIDALVEELINNPGKEFVI